MKSAFTLTEISKMLDMSIDEIKEEIEKGRLSYTFQEGTKKLTLYDLEKYMGEEQTRKITQDYMNNRDQ